MQTTGESDRACEIVDKMLIELGIICAEPVKWICPQDLPMENL